MHVEQTARLETFDIFSHAARTGCSVLLHAPPPSSDGAFDGPLDDSGVGRTSKVEKEDDVRLMDGMEESDDFMDNGELGELGESVSGECGVGLPAASPCHKGTGCCFPRRKSKDGHSREKLGPVNDTNEALAEVVGENDPDALKDPIATVVNFDKSRVNFDDFEDTENWDRVRDRLCDGRKFGLSSSLSRHDFRYFLIFIYYGNVFIRSTCCPCILQSRI